MPTQLRFDLPTSFISKETYKKALHIVTNQETMMVKQRKPSLGVVWFVLSQSQSVHKRLTPILISKYLDVRDGKWPTDGMQSQARRSVEQANVVRRKLLDIKNSMYMVIQPADDTPVCSCEANHYKLVCSLCKSFAHDGICKHVLAVTHVKMGEEVGAKNPMVNLKLLTRKLSVQRGSSDGRPTAPTPALVPQPRRQVTSCEADSSDDEQELLASIQRGDEGAW